VRNAQTLLGRIALAEGNYEEAVSRLEQGDQQQAWTLYHLGRAYEGNGQMAQALEAYRTAARNHQFNSLPYARIRMKAEEKLAELSEQSISQN
jgi:tetratricopeptide (TPR) repeat protein